MKEPDTHEELREFLVMAASRLGLRIADAEDIAHEAFIRAMRHWTNCRKPGLSVRAWLDRIVLNTWYDQRRKNRSRGGNHAALPADLSTEAGPAGGAWEQLPDSMTAALMAMPTVNREAFLLFALEGMSYREIALHVGAVENCIRSRIKRARDFLRGRIAAGGAFQSPPTNPLPRSSTRALQPGIVPIPK